MRRAPIAPAATQLDMSPACFEGFGGGGEVTNSISLRASSASATLDEQRVLADETTAGVVVGDSQAAIGSKN